MRKVILICILLLGVCFSWLIAEWANLTNSYPWYLEYFPAWADRIIYSVSRGMLATDMSIAAKQIDFIETFVPTVLAISAFNVIILAMINKFIFNEQKTD